MKKSAGRQRRVDSAQRRKVGVFWQKFWDICHGCPSITPRFKVKCDVGGARCSLPLVLRPSLPVHLNITRENGNICSLDVVSVSLFSVPMAAVLATAYC